MENERVPLAQRMRPDSLENFVGQEHIVGKNKMLWRAIEFGHVGSCIFYGPPGTGKTTLANIIAKNTNNFSFFTIENQHHTPKGQKKTQKILEKQKKLVPLQNFLESFLTSKKAVFLNSSVG